MVPNFPANTETSESNVRLKSELDFLFSRINYERTTVENYPKHFKLKSMRRLLSELGEPQQQYSIVHVAGTKGKGSVCKMIAGALTRSGISTGVYSSPHIESIRERISMNGAMIDSDALARLLAECRQAVERLDLVADQNDDRKNSFFEIITAAALLHFQQAGAERVVLEVGLGGRLDSTNVCEPELCVITNISLDHTRQLGSTVDRIAREKAGIIKRHVPVISGATDIVAAKEIRETSSVCDAPLREAQRDFHSKVTSIDGTALQTVFDIHGNLVDGTAYELKDVVINSPGRHQAENGATAIAALKQLQQNDPRISDEGIRGSLAEFSLIGRGEILSRDPTILLDMAHNVASVEALTAIVKRLQANICMGNSTLVFASSCDKDINGMMRLLLPLFDRVILTKFVENPRGTAPDDLLHVAEQVIQENKSTTETKPTQIETISNPNEVWQYLLQTEFSTEQLSATAPFLCVAGSAFLIAEMRPLISAWMSESKNANE